MWSAEKRAEGLEYMHPKPSSHSGRIVGQCLPMTAIVDLRFRLNGVVVGSNPHITKKNAQTGYFREASFLRGSDA